MPNVQGFKSAAQRHGFGPAEVETFLSLAHQQDKPLSTVLAENGQQSMMDAMGKEGINPGDLDSLGKGNTSFLSQATNPAPSAPSSPALPTMPTTALPTDKSPVPTLNSPTSTNSGSLSSSLPTLPTSPLPKQGSILPGSFALGTPAMAHQSADQFSGGVNYGRDVLVPKGTPVATPGTGKWKVVESFNGATSEGSGQSTAQKAVNRGYGNSVLLENALTGERMRYSHLSDNQLQPGQLVDGGTVFGKSGATGNVAGPTGQHLDIEYYDGSGKIRDIMDSPYGQMMFGTGASDTQQPQTPPTPPIEMQAPPPLTSSPMPAAPSSPLGNSDIPAAQNEFITRFLPSAQQVEQKYGIPVAITLAQAGLESGWNPNASTLFGMKGTGDAGSANLGTKEQGANGLYSTTGNFAKYSNTDAAFDAYGKLLSTNPRYAPVMAALRTGNVPGAIEMIKQSGYATDKDYVAKINNIINTYKLNQLPSTYLQR